MGAGIAVGVDVDLTVGLGEGVGVKFDFPFGVGVAGTGFAVAHEQFVLAVQAGFRQTAAGITREQTWPGAQGGIGGWKQINPVAHLEVGRQIDPHESMGVGVGTGFPIGVDVGFGVGVDTCVGTGVGELQSGCLEHSSFA